MPRNYMHINIDETDIHPLSTVKTCNIYTTTSRRNRNRKKKQQEQITCKEETEKKKHMNVDVEGQEAGNTYN